MSGIHPEVWPTAEERRKAEAQMLDPKEDYFHCAIAGLAGSGKSSLINAFRGLRNNLTTAGVAPTGVTETTVNITAYLDPSPGSRFVWYDVPGAGTIKIKGWQYFNSQGLFVFDLIIVVIDNRFSEQDLIILQHCERYKIPSFIVRSKANQHIDNTMRQQLNWEDTDDERDFNEVYLQARDGLVKKTRASVKDNLRRGKLDSNKKVYIVSCDALVSVICDQPKKLRKLNQPIDEVELKETLYEAILARRTWSAEGAQS
ncbi:P-loop containing nucleoside triphosphate hydrolase protein [Tirmania nivea]|nr:P-loop containing nucleoside triphosphate hydrolase protein [Tirmania nivea]